MDSLEPIVSIEINKKVYEIKPTIRLLGSIERKIGESILKLLGKQDRLIHETLIILKEALKEVSDLSEGDIEEYVFNNYVMATALSTRFLTISFQRMNKPDLDLPEETDKKDKKK